MRTRVLWLVKGLGLGGAERLIMSLAPRLDRERVDLEVAYLLPGKDSHVVGLTAAGITVHCLHARRTLDAGWVVRLRRLLHERRYDVVHTHSPLPAAAARLVAPRDTRLVHTEHNVWEAYRTPTRLANAVTYRRNTAVWAVSEGVAATIRPPRWLPGRLPPVTTVLHGVEVEAAPRGSAARARARARLDVGSATPVVGSVANLTPKKDPLTLIAAIEEVRRVLPDLVCYLIGTGPMEREVQAAIVDRGLEEHVRLLGVRDDVPDLLPGLDVFALSSRYEGLGLSLVEAMAAEVACVATDVGGVPEIITDRVDGRLVPVGDPAALAAALIELLTDRSARAALGRAGRARASAAFGALGPIVHAMEALYATTADRGDGPEGGRARMPQVARREDRSSPSGRGRILWLTKGLGLGGAERLLTVMAPKLDPERFELEVAYLLPWKDAFVPTITGAGIAVHCLGASRTVDPSWVWRLRRLLHDGDFDIVHTHAPVPAAAARLLAPRGTRFVHTEHNVWQRYRLPTRLINAWTYGRNTLAFGVSDGVTDSIAPPIWALGRPPTAVTLLHGVDADEVPRGSQARARARELLHLDVEVPVIGTVANLTRKKDQATLLAAIDRLRARVPDVVLCLIGSGPLEEELRSDVQRRGLEEHVRFLGSRDDVPELLPGFEVYTLSSRYEGLPISMLEAMAAEVAVAVTAVGGIPEAITDHLDGVLVPAGDPEALSRAYAEVLGDPGLRGRLAVAGRARVADAFSIDRAVQVTAAAYRDLLGRS